MHKPATVRAVNLVAQLGRRLIYRDVALPFASPRFHTSQRRNEQCAMCCKLAPDQLPSTSLILRSGLLQCCSALIGVVVLA